MKDKSYLLSTDSEKSQRENYFPTGIMTFVMEYFIGH